MLTFWQLVLVVTIFSIQMIGLTVLKTELEIRKAKILQKDIFNETLKSLETSEEKAPLFDVVDDEDIVI